MSVARDKQLHGELGYWNWLCTLGDLTPDIMLRRLCTAILQDDILTIQLFFEYDNGAILDWVDRSISFFHLIMWYGSLETIEMCCWYMRDTPRYKIRYNCFAKNAQCDPNGSYARMIKDRAITRTQRDQTCRSSPTDVARNDIDIFAIWQHTAHDVYNGLCNVFPNPLALMVMAYAMQPLVPPHVSPGKTFSSIIKKKLCY